MVFSRFTVFGWVISVVRLYALLGGGLHGGPSTASAMKSRQEPEWHKSVCRGELASGSSSWHAGEVGH